MYSSKCQILPLRHLDFPTLVFPLLVLHEALAHLIIATNQSGLFFLPLLIEKLTFHLHCVN